MFRRFAIVSLCCVSAMAAVLCAAMRARAEMPVASGGGVLACCANRPAEKHAPIGPQDCTCCEMPGLSALPPAAKSTVAKPVKLDLPGPVTWLTHRPVVEMLTPRWITVRCKPPDQSLVAQHVQLTC